MASTAPASRDPLPEHLPVLDGLRGLAILLVLVRHFFDHLPVTPRFVIAIDRTLAAGSWTGVDLFFVLSGFLITRILLRTKTSPRYFASFYGRRVLRIFPLYYAALVVMLVVLPLASAWWRQAVSSKIPDQILLWTYTGNLVGATLHQEPLIHFWSLMVEEHFYLVWPLLVWLLSPKALLRTCLALMALGVVARSGMLAAGWSPWLAYSHTLARLDSLSCGGMIAVLFWLRGAGADLGRIARGAMVVAAVGLVGVAAHARGFFYDDPWMQRVGYTLFAIFWGGVLVSLVTARPREARRGPHQTSPAGTRREGLMTSRFMTLFGKYSYGIYVYHPLIRYFVLLPLGVRARLDAIAGPAVGAFLNFVVGTALVFGVAVISYELFESRFLKLKRFFEYGPKAPREPSVAVAEGDLR
jgi:peptidoglycan/LPS O-acetylase OafA/YrhL